MKNWTDTLEQYGPDWFFEITIDRSVAEHLKALKFQGYRHYTAQNRTGLITKIPGSYDWYIDKYHYEQFIANIEGKNQQNLWNFACILLENNQLQFQRGYGLEDETLISTENKVLIAVLREPSVTINSWLIYAGGHNASPKTLAQGNNASTLMEYLDIKDSDLH